MHTAGQRRRAAHLSHTAAPDGALEELAALAALTSLDLSRTLPAREAGA